MGYLVHILLAVVALGLPELAGQAPREEPLGVCALLCVPFVLGRVLALTIARGRFRVAGIASRLLSASPVVCFALMVGACGWTETVQRWTHSEAPLLGWPRPELLIAFAPFVVLQTIAIDARARAYGSGRAADRWRAFQFRLFLSGLVPMGVYFAVSIAVGAVPELRTRIEEVALYNALFAAAMLTLLAALMPTLLRYSLETERVPDGPLRDMLGDVAKHAGFRARELLVWRTGHTLSNAAIVGLSARTRVVMFSDLLLAQLDPRQLAAVFAHEMGHAVKRHVLVFALLTIGFFLTLDFAVTEYVGDDVVIGGAVVLASIVGGYFAFGWLSRRYELEADLYSVSVLRDPEAIVGALEKVGGSFRDVASWRHFSTAKRVEFLRGLTHDPERGRKLVRLLRGVTIGAWLLFVLAVSLQAWSVLRRAPQDFVRADLRLGLYASAGARGAAVEEPLASLVARARELGRDGVTVEELETGARLAFADGDAERAWQFLALGGLRDRSDLAALADAVQTLAHDPAADVTATLPSEVAESWRGELAALRHRERHVPAPR